MTIIFTLNTKYIRLHNPPRSTQAEHKTKPYGSIQLHLSHYRGHTETKEASSPPLVTAQRGSHAQSQVHQRLKIQVNSTIDADR